MNSLEGRVVHALSDLHDSYHVTGVKAESDPRASGWREAMRPARRRSRLPFVPSCRPHAPSSSGAAASRIRRCAALWVVVRPTTNSAPPRSTTLRRPFTRSGGGKER